MKKITIITMVWLMLSGLAFAGTKENLAGEILKLTDIRKMSDQVITQVMQMQLSQLKPLNIPQERLADQSAFQDKVKSKLIEVVSWEKLEAEYGKFLAEVYTEDELKAVLAFSKTPAGQSIVKKEPIIMGKIMMLMQSKIQSVLPEIQKMTRDFSESVKKIK
jgi:hypothetical protein